MTCCSSISDLGCIYSCDTIQIGINAPTTGTYTIELQPDGVKVVSTENTAGSPLVFPGGYLNEDAVSVFKIIKPDGTYLESGVYDCFQVSIKPTTNAALANVDIEPIACASAKYQLRDSAGTLINSGAIASGASANITAPDGIINLINSDSDPISTETVRSNQTKPVTIANVIWTDSDGSAESTPYGDPIVCAPQVQDIDVVFNPIAIADDTSGEWTNTGTTATFTSISDDGSSGTITVSVNGGAYAAFVNPTAVANGETLQVRRTVTTGVGTVTITGTYA